MKTKVAANSLGGYLDNLGSAPAAPSWSSPSPPSFVSKASGAVGASAGVGPKAATKNTGSYLDNLGSAPAVQNWSSWSPPSVVSAASGAASGAGYLSALGSVPAKKQAASNSESADLLLIDRIQKKQRQSTGAYATSRTGRGFRSGYPA